MTLSRYKVSSWGDEGVLKSNYGDECTLCNYSQNQ